MNRRFAGILTALAIGTVSPLAMASAAEASPSCPEGVVCLHYNSGWQGAFFQTWYSISDFAGYKFKNCSVNGSGCAGYELDVKNNAASATNTRDGGATIYFNSNYKGAYDVIWPNSADGQLSNTYNENASIKVY
ncbi:peptidase inhibitor family I36 protein [Streptomyces sp. NBC_01353]|uniref:peptidase inhibitor family I36 protein n=1 Tax=Streptomyces sp. NBC_01353 TaxID=2903835 RepID=UPI002E37D8BD|nr:peptidase inhibitor family I36 protein [Streptomyces sp. NBC_01353]